MKNAEPFLFVMAVIALVFYFFRTVYDIFGDTGMAIAMALVTALAILSKNLYDESDPDKWY